MDLGIPGLEMGAMAHADAVAESWDVTVAGEARTLRILRAELEGREDARLLFEEEKRRIQRLAHPTLLRVHEASRGGPRPWMLTDPASAQTLAARTGRDGPLPEAEALTLAASLHEGFRYLQARKQIHVAPDPGNLVLIGQSWRLVTFRHVRAWDELRLRKGKSDPWPEMSAPERTRAHPAPLRPEPFISWALGALLRWMVAGVEPGVEAPAGAAPRALALSARLLAPEPDHRPQGEAAVTRLLAGEEAVPGGAGGSAPAPIKAPIPRRKRRGH